MSGTKAKVVALVLVVAGVLGIFALTQRGSVRSHVINSYDVKDRDGNSYTLHSDDDVTRTAADIKSAWKPAQELVDPGGTFLRYSGDIVAVTPDVEGGSTIYLDDEDRGYNRWFPYVVGFWGFGGSGGPIGGTRGGGPGAGK